MCTVSDQCYYRPNSLLGIRGNDFKHLKNAKNMEVLVCLFDLILLVLVINFSVMSGWVFLVEPLVKAKINMLVLLKDKTH